ncbi:2OG-Fe(II) oxygenase [Roseateles sp. BYS180W]|uniref:2OG-Fe(II) oxygenase n=1 Tax=Roseateles rivi TaxID=3299028 RepID=A0ABW7FQS5_9BURK
MAVQHLTPEWQSWLRSNLERGCATSVLLPLLEQGGWPSDVAQDALAAACDPLHPDWLGPLALPRRSAVATNSSLLTRPQPRLQHNQYRCRDGTLVRMVMHHQQPELVLMLDVLSPKECEALMHGAAQTPQGQAPAAELRRLHARVEQRLSELLGWPLEQSEALQVQRYGPGGQSRAHTDFFDRSDPDHQALLAQGGQRVGTSVLYLSEVQTGGATHFVRQGLELRPVQGAWLYFANVDAQGQEDQATWHAGMPVVSGVKYLAVQWHRQQRCRHIGNSEA